MDPAVRALKEAELAKKEALKAEKMAAREAKKSETAARNELKKGQLKADKLAKKEAKAAAIQEKLDSMADKRRKPAAPKSDEELEEERLERREYQKLKWLENKDERNKKRFLRRHTMNPEMKINARSLAKYEITVDGQKAAPVVLKDITDVEKNMIRNFKVPPPPRPKKIYKEGSYADVMEWIENNFKVKKSAVKMVIQIGSNDPKFAEIQDLRPLFNDFQKVDKNLTAFYPVASTLLGRFNTIMWLISNYTYLAQTLSKEAIVFYDKRRDAKSALVAQVAKDVADRANNLIPKFAHIKERILTVFGKDSLEWLYMRLWEDTKGRDDFGFVVVIPYSTRYDEALKTKVNILDPNQNYIILHDPRESEKEGMWFYLQDYKTAKSKGQKRKDISPEVQALIKAWRTRPEHINCPYLFGRKIIMKGAPHWVPYGKMGDHMNDAFAKAGLRIDENTRFTTRMLRNSYVTWSRTDEAGLSLDQLRELAIEMNHNFETAEKNYRRVEKPTVSVDTSDVFNQMLEEGEFADSFGEKREKKAPAKRAPAKAKGVPTIPEESGDTDEAPPSRNAPDSADAVKAKPVPAKPLGRAKPVPAKPRAKPVPAKPAEKPVPAPERFSGPTGEGKNFKNLNKDFGTVPLAVPPKQKAKAKPKRKAKPKAKAAKN